MPGPTYGAAGLQIQTVDEIQADLIALWQTGFGASIQAGNGNAVVGNLVSAQSLVNRALQEGLDQAWLAGFLADADGVVLDRTAVSFGILRNPATATTVAVSIANSSGAPIAVAQGAVVTLDSTGAIFAVVTGVVSPAGGAVAATVRAVEKGPTAVGAGGTWAWAAAFAGSNFLTVTNAAPGTTGASQETDAELRLRIVASAHLPAKGTVQGIRSAVADLDGVTYALVFENDTDFMGIVSPVAIPLLPAHSFTVVTVGGAAADIGAAIFAQKPTGIYAYGNQTVAVVDSDGYTSNVRYEAASAVPIFVSATIHGASASYSDAIKNAIAAYIGGELVDSTAVVGLSVGATILRVALESAIFAAAGPDCTEVTALLFDDVGPPVTGANLALPWNRYPYCDASNVAVITLAFVP